MAQARRCRRRASTRPLATALLTVDGCERLHDNSGYCSPHAHRYRRYGNAVAHPTPRPPIGDPAGWRKDDVGYLGAHTRTRRLRGKAEQYSCVDCGAQAHDWAYDHLDSDERTEQMGEYTLAYSLDPAHYAPLCRSCHVLFDKQHAAA
ncbi:hypothetical protein [Mycolicibacterium sp. A43C]